MAGELCDFPDESAFFNFQVSQKQSWNVAVDTMIIWLIFNRIKLQSMLDKLCWHDTYSIRSAIIRSEMWTDNEL